MELEPEFAALRRSDDPAGLSQRREGCRKELNPAFAVGAAFAEELSRQIRLPEARSS
jgi:hypothetical protein